uniref:Uncharacterized protein n=1 Tax=viral metagenome TaxID=1070528 RepID=A0A6C0KEP5_9ZZZZ
MDTNEIMNQLKQLASINITDIQKKFKNTKTQELYKELTQAENNITNGEEQLVEAERNYYTYTEGTQWYNNFLENNVEKEVEKKAKHLERKFNDKKREIKDNIRRLKSQKLSVDNINNLMEDNNDNIIHVADRIENLDSKSRVNERLTYYQNENIEHYQSYFHIIHQIKTVLLIVFAVFIFIYHKQYKNLYAWGTFIALIFLPTIFSILAIISQKIIELLTFLYSIFN